jgi:hypothetical protein
MGDLLSLPLDTEIDGQEYSQIIITAMGKLKSSAQNLRCDAICDQVENQPRISGKR